MSVKKEENPETPTKKRKISSNESSCSSRMTISSGFTKEALKNLNEFRQDGFLCDFQIKVKGKVFRVHRNVLAARSAYFKAFFVVNSRHEAMDLKDVEKDAVYQCILLMYTGEITLSVEFAEPLLRVAKLFQLYDAFELYFSYFTAKLSPTNCLAIKNVVDKFDGKKISEQAEKMIIENLDSIINNKDFLRITKRDLAKYVSKVMKTPIVWKAITVWASHEYPLRQDAFIEILATLDLSHFTFEELDNMMGNRLVMSSPKTVAVIANEIFRRFASGKVTFNFRNWNFMKSIFRSYGLTDLENKVNKFVLENFASVSRTPEFSKIDKNDLIFFLKAFPLSMATERIVWSALIKWVKFDEERMKSFPEMLKLMELSKFSVSFIKSVVKNEPMVAADNDCLKLVIDALLALMK